MRKNTRKALSRLLIGILWLSLLGTPLAESRQVVCAAEVSGGDVSGNDSNTPGDAGDISGNDSATRGTQVTYPITTVITREIRAIYPGMIFRQGMCRETTSCR